MIRLVGNCLAVVLMLATCSINAAEHKKALVIGNADYDYADKLANPERDATAIATRLRSLGFYVTEKHSLTLRGMKEALLDYSSTLNSDTISVVYYAGHGVQKNNHNYLIPVDANIQQSYEIEYSSVDLQMLLDAINEASPLLNLVLLDACRDNPFEQNLYSAFRSVRQHGQGLTAVESIGGAILSFATQPGNIAVDGVGDHSPYAGALLQHIATPGKSVQEFLNQVGLDVVAATRGNQVPWYSSSPVPEYCLAGCELPSHPPTAAHRTAFQAPNDTDRHSNKRAALSDAIMQRDWPEIDRLASLSAEQKALLKDLFSQYPRMTVAWQDTVTRSLASANAHPESNHETVEIRILEAINRQGNRVLPSRGWRTLSVSLKP